MTTLKALRNTTPRQTINTLIVVASMIGAIVFPWVVDPALVGVGFIALIYAMRNFTWNIAGGLVGLLSLAHVAGFGIGAFTVAILTWGHGVNVWLAILVGMLLSGLVGIVVSSIMSRFGVNAFFFALGTAALSLAVSGIAASWSLTGEVDGLQNHTSGEGLLHLQWFLDPKPLYYVALILLVVIVCFTMWLTSRTRFGRSLPFIREDPDMAASMGIDVVRNQALTMGLSMALTAIPGSLIAQYTSFVSYESVLTLEIGILMMVGAIIGGSSTLAGPIVAGIGIAALEEGLRAFDVTSSSVSSITQIIYAAIVILILRLGADGIVPMWNALLDRLFPSREHHEVEPELESNDKEPAHA
ncbi:branched-chain amino acid ABC transporter permease [Marihabitans asiaticum]|uniref:Amino acid/amide ABC transporter membrane protein 2 (HAAT family) n=1 Tax=Marihabitans asiaticum TaxID=415218 RepID=A0A560WGC4_9MICO|nr:branched-chain amino acid ABC transporter permease [Marihabitans asiaticum]TWD16729.1 amino acid/amide ABC transporter membrane protein 2 (HAAT family) [Marihabitans asiaticum]